MRYHEDILSFRTPLRAAFAEVEEEIVAAGRRVAGAAARTAAALAARDALHRFKDRLQGHIKAGSFAQLPGLRTSMVPLGGHWRHLTCDPWRGVFLVSPQVGIAIGLLFSRAPHDLGPRLWEAAVRHQAALQPPP